MPLSTPITFAAVFRDERCISVAAARMFSGTGLEAALAGRGAHGVEIAAAAAREILRRGVGDPRLDAERRLAGCGGSEYCVPLHDDCTTCHG